MLFYFTFFTHLHDRVYRVDLEIANITMTYSIHFVSDNVNAPPHSKLDLREYQSSPIICGGACVCGGGGGRYNALRKVRCVSLNEGYAEWKITDFIQIIMKYYT